MTNIIAQATKYLAMLFLALVLAGCGATSPANTPVPTSTIALPTVTIIPVTNTLEPVSTPSIISSTSPNGNYKVSLDTSNTYLELTIVDIKSKQETRLPLNQKNSDIVDEIKWSPDGRLLAITFHNDDYSNEIFDVINIADNKFIATYSGASHIYAWNGKEDVIVLEHGGLNNIFDYYFTRINCYKLVFDGDCINSSPPGTWQFHALTWEYKIEQWGFPTPDSEDPSVGDSFYIIATNAEGTLWKYSYKSNNPDRSVSARVIHWSKDGKFVYFVPSAPGEEGYYSDSDYGLLKMDLDTGKVTEIIIDSLEFKNEYQDISISPSDKKAFYVKVKNALSTVIIKDLATGKETVIPSSISSTGSAAIFPKSTKENVILTSEIFWSPDETKVFVINNLTTGLVDEISSDANYTIFDLQTGKITTILRDSQTYYSVFELKNDKISLINEAAFFGSGESLEFSLLDGKLISKVETSP